MSFMQQQIYLWGRDVKTLYDGDTFTHEGMRFIVRFEHDADSGAPWDGCDGRGLVRKSTSPHYDGKSDKRPGERPMNQPDRNEYQFYYDWRETLKIAKRDGWNTEPFDAPNPAVRAVQADFDYLRAWLNDDWQYVGVVVQRIGADDEPIGESVSLWGVETCKDYHCAAAHELAEALAHAARETWRKALHEARERNYWAARDVQTERVAT